MAGTYSPPPQAHVCLRIWRQTGFSEPALSAQIVFRFAAHRCVARETHAAARNDTRLVAGTDIFR
jgi:hypothetical protein